MNTLLYASSDSALGGLCPLLFLGGVVYVIVRACKGRRQTPARPELRGRAATPVVRVIDATPAHRPAAVPATLLDDGKDSFQKFTHLGQPVDKQRLLSQQVGTAPALATVTPAPKIHFACPACRTPLAAPPEVAGRRRTCGGCGAKVHVPSEADAAEVVLPADDPPKPAPAVPFSMHIPKLGGVHGQVSQETANTLMKVIAGAFCTILGVLVVIVFGRRINRS